MERERPYLTKKRSFITWDWWQESPIEIILVVFILVAFLIPRAGCGITPKSDVAAQQAAQQAAQVPAEPARPAAE
jgi:hypothetical protein